MQHSLNEFNVFKSASNRHTLHYEIAVPALDMDAIYNLSKAAKLSGFYFRFTGVGTEVVNGKTTQVKKIRFWKKYSPLMCDMERLDISRCVSHLTSVMMALHQANRATTVTFRAA